MRVSHIRLPHWLTNQLHIALLLSSLLLYLTLSRSLPLFAAICAIVEYEYAAKEPDELDLHKGAIIHRIKQMPGGWWQGTLKASGLTGMFPDNFVRVLEPSSNGNLSGDDSAAVQLRLVTQCV